MTKSNKTSVSVKNTQEKILKNFEKFLKSGFARKNFTQILYKHLSLNFGFIAHYDINGFYESRFAEAEGRLITVNQILSASPWTFNNDSASGCGELNRAIYDLVKENSLAIVQAAQEQEISELEAAASEAQVRIKEIKERLTTGRIF
jgi:hypothetical protein